MTIATVNQIAQTSLIAQTSDIDRLRAELAAERARADRAEAMLKTAEQTAKQLTELRKIFRGNDWGPTERGTLAAMLFHGWEQSQTTTQWLHVCEGGAAALADIANVSRGTACNIVDRFVDTGIISRDISRTAVNRFGEEIKSRHFDKDRGDHWQNASTIAVTATLPNTLPELPNNTKQAKASRAKASEVRKLANMAKKALQLPCPCCGVVGELHIACTACNHTFTANELVELEQQAKQRDTTETTRRAKSMTNEQKHKATQRRRMRETRGVASTPGASVTYEYDEQTPGELDIKIVNGPKQGEIRESTNFVLSQNQAESGKAQNLDFSYRKAQNQAFPNASIGLEGTKGATFEGPPTDWGWIMSVSEIQSGVSCE